MDYDLKELAPSALTIMVLNALGGVIKHYADFLPNKWIPLVLIAAGVPLFMAASQSWTFFSGVYGFIHAVGAVGLYSSFKSTTEKNT